MIINPFRMRISHTDGEIIENFLNAHGIMCSSMVNEYTNIVFKGGLEFFTSCDNWHCDKYPESMIISFAEFIKTYIDPLPICRVVHHKKEPYDVLICRPSKYGNPFSHKDNTLAEFKVNTRQEAVAAYREWITSGDGMYLLDDLHELKGKILGCWCSPQKCHGDILVELVNNL